MTARTAVAAHLGIDLGTSSVKVVVVGEHGEQLAQADAAYAVHHPVPGWSESVPLDWWNATATAVHEVVAKVPNVRPASIGLSGQMHGVVPTRRDGNPARNGILWADSRAQAQLDVYRNLPVRTRRRLANPISAGMAGPILGWLVRHERDVMDATRWALQPKDWLRLQLTGEVHTEPSDASATLMYDVLSDTWAVDVVEALDVDPGILPVPLPSAGSAAGRLTLEAAEHLGLPAGTPVAAGAADTAAAALGSGLVAPGTAQLTIGTGVQIVTPADRPPTGTADPVTHYYRAATDAGHYEMAAVLNGGLALRWVCDVLGASWAELYTAAAQPPRADGPLFLPHLGGERTPYMDASMRGAWTGLAPQHTRRDLLRAALEGVALATGEALAALFPEGPVVDHLRLAGGGTGDPAWRQLLADVLDVELRAVAVPGASGRGAALLGARAAGLMEEGQVVELGTPAVTSVVQPDAGTACVYRDRRSRFREAVQQLRTASHPSSCTSSHPRRTEPGSGPTRGGTAHD
jgi:xylulokinase